MNAEQSLAAQIKKDDSRNLIGALLEMEGIHTEECRSVFLDWALGLAAEDIPQAAARLLRYHTPPKTHPIYALLETATQPIKTAPRRRNRRKSQE